ncbi:MAG: HEAT repeat domain-containing protein [Asgard group archaeon]|nr:HEAT repeat domain-containing protein [Asgard group archaeon]
MHKQESLVKKLSLSSTPAEKWEIINQLGKVKDKTVIDELVKILDSDTNIQIKSYAARALVKIGGKITLRKLVTLLNSDSWITRMKVAEILGELKYEAAVKPLIKALQTEKEPGVKEWLIISLGKIGEPKALDILINKLEHDKDWEIRMEAANALGEINNKKACQALLKSYQEDSNSTVRWTALAAIYTIDQDYSKINVEKLCNKLTNIVKNSSNEFLIAAAAKTLGKIGDYSVVEDLLYARKMHREMVRLEIDLALRKIAQKHGFSSKEELIDKINY